MASMQDFYNLPKGQQAGIVGGALFLVACAIGYWAYQGLNDLGPDPAVPSFLRRNGDGTSYWNRIASTDQQITQANAYIDRGPSIEARLEALQEEIKVARGLLPKDKEKEQVREMLQKFMREVPDSYAPQHSDKGAVHYLRCNITERGGSEGRSRRGAKPSEFKAIVYQTQVQATMEGLISFIDAVETNTERFMIVEKISISPGAIDVDEELKDLVFVPHLVDLDIVTYVYQEAGS